jgi:1-acyl-sn-glycerol-3-phosphate acyltransferase
MIDIIACAAAIPHDYGYAAKAELRSVPFIGSVLERCACVFVDRSNPRRAVQSIREAAALIRGGNSVLVYPEGERTYGPYLLPFMRGAFMLAVEAGVPLVPVVQLDNYAALDEKRRVARPGTVHVVIGEPIPTAGYTRKDIPELVDRVFGVMARELEAFHGVPVGPPPGASVSSAAPPTPPQ